MAQNFFVHSVGDDVAAAGAVVAVAAEQHFVMVLRTAAVHTLADSVVSALPWQPERYATAAHFRVSYSCC